MFTASDIAERLNRARRLREGRYVAQCPVHQGGDNLYVSDGDTTTILKCHAGCATNDVLEAIGLKMRDLFAGKAPKKIYDPYNDASAILIYRADAALGKKVTDSDARFINAAGKRLHKNNYILDRTGNLKKRVNRNN